MDMFQFTFNLNPFKGPINAKSVKWVSDAKCLLALDKAPFTTGMTALVTEQCVLKQNCVKQKVKVMATGHGSTTGCSVVCQLFSSCKHSTSAGRCLANPDCLLGHSEIHLDSNMFYLKMLL